MTTGTGDVGAAGTELNLAAAQTNVAVTTHATGKIYLRDTGALTLGAITTAGGLVDIATTGTGLLTVGGAIGTSGGNLSLSGVGVNLSTANSDVTAGSGNVTIDAGTGTFTMASGASIQTSGNVTVAADSIALNTSATPALLKSTAGEVKLVPNTGTMAINLGPTASAAFALTASELNTIEAPIVRIGDGTGASPFGSATSGAITFTGTFAADCAVCDGLPGVAHAAARRRWAIRLRTTWRSRAVW